MYGEPKAAGGPHADPEAGMLHRFRLELHGLWNGFVVQVGHAGMGGRSFVVQLGGDTEEDFEVVIDAIREAYSAHRAQRGEA